jgi:hypothetical protein
MEYLFGVLIAFLIQAAFVWITYKKLFKRLTRGDIAMVVVVSLFSWWAVAGIFLTLIFSCIAILLSEIFSSKFWDKEIF